MTLIQSAKLNGLDPYAYLSDVLKRLPTHKVLREGLGRVGQRVALDLGLGTCGLAHDAHDVHLSVLTLDQASGFERGHLVGAPGLHGLLQAQIHLG